MPFRGSWELVLCFKGYVCDSLAFLEVIGTMRALYVDLILNYGNDEDDYNDYDDCDDMIRLGKLKKEASYCSQKTLFWYHPPFAFKWKSASSRYVYCFVYCVTVYFAFLAFSSSWALSDAEVQGAFARKTMW